MRERHGAPAVLVALVTAGMIVAAPASAVTIDTTARTVTAAKISMGWSTTSTPDQVDSVRWTDSAATQTGNLASNNSGGGGCGAITGPTEFWGQSLGSMSGGGSIDPVLVLQGSAGTWSAPRSNRVQIDSSFPTSCSGYTAAVPVSTTYTYFDSATYQNEVRVTRTYGFDVATPPFTQSDGFRAYVPRLPRATYPTVVYPTASSGLGSIDAGLCSSPCFPSDFDQSAGWFAMESSAGSGMIVRRDPGNSTPGKLEVDNDDNSASNLSDFDLLNPGGGTTSGFTAAVNETEYLCFFDATSWTSAQQAALQLPAGCGPVPVPANTTPPTVPASPQPGVQVSADPGAWTESPSSYAFQWVACGADGSSNCADIAGATGQTYTPAAGDLGKTLEVRVVATNESGDSAPATSAASKPVASPPPPPVAPQCALKALSRKIALRKPKNRHGAPADTLLLSVRCDQGASVTVKGTITVKPRHGRKRHVGLAMQHTTVLANVAKTLRAKLPKAAFTALKRKAKATVALKLTATNANGQSALSGSVALKGVAGFRLP
jgi:hypothetical protein